MLWRVGLADLLDDCRDHAVVTVVVGDELAAAFGTQVLKAKSERHDVVLHGFHQSLQRFVLRRDNVILP